MEQCPTRLVTPQQHLTGIQMVLAHTCLHRKDLYLAKKPFGGEGGAWITEVILTTYIVKVEIFCSKWEYQSDNEPLGPLYTAMHAMVR